MRNQKPHQDHYWQEDNHWSDKDNYSSDKHHDGDKDKCCHKDNHWHDKDKCSSDYHHDWDKDKCHHKDDHWHDKDKCSSGHHHDWDKDKCHHKDDHWHDKDKCSSDKHHDGKKHRRCFDLYPGSPCCDDRFSVRLAGLEGGLNFRLRQLIGQEIQLFLNFPEETVIIGVVIEVGGDYVEIKPTGLFPTLSSAQFPGGNTLVSFEHIAKIVAPKSKKRKHYSGNKHDKLETVIFDEFAHKPGCLCAECKTKRRKKYSKKKFW